MLSNKTRKQIEEVKMLFDTLNSIETHTKDGSSRIYDKAFNHIEEELVCAISSMLDKDCSDDE
jgi:hypothetical protein